MFFNEIISFVPINSLKYLCLKRISTIIKPASESKESIPSSSSISQQPCSLSQDNSKTQSNLHLPIKVNQLIIDFLTQQVCQYRADFLIALLSKGGCYSLDLQKILSCNFFKDDEIALLFNTLSKNGSFLRRLYLPYFPAQWRLLCENNFAELQHLNISQIDKLADLITVFSTCPKLIGLYVSNWNFEISHYQSSQEITNIFHELSKPVYNVRNSIRELKLGRFIGEFIKMKLINLFPNLIKLECHNYENIFDIVLEPEDLVQETELDPKDFPDTPKILSQLQTLILQDPNYPIYKILSFQPNFQEVKLDFRWAWDELDIETAYNINILKNLKQLKKLTLIGPFSTESLLPILVKVGHNLEYLSCSLCTNINVSIIGRKCPNLKYLDIQAPNQLTFDQEPKFSSMTDQERESEENRFRHLETLYIYYKAFVRIPIIGYILKNAVDIDHIHLDCIFDQIDEQLNELMENNTLNNLRALTLSSCLFGPMYDKLMNSSNKLCYSRVRCRRKRIASN